LILAEIAKKNKITSLTSAELYITNNTPIIAMNCAKVKQGNMLVLTDYELLAGAVPVV